MKVDFVTYCCPKDIHRLHEPGHLRALVSSCAYPFDNVYVIQQECRQIEDIESFDYPCTVIETEDFDHQAVRHEFGVSDPNEIADRESIGSRQYWKNLCLNPFIGLKVSDADYIVFSDCDVVIKDVTAGSWVEKGIELLKRHSHVIMVCPGHGVNAGSGLGEGIAALKVVSQMIFVCERERFKDLDFELPIHGEPGHFNFVFEGRVQRCCEQLGLRRAMLPPEWGIIHHYGW